MHLSAYRIRHFNFKYAYDSQPHDNQNLMNGSSFYVYSTKRLVIGSRASHQCIHLSKSFVLVNQGRKYNTSPRCGIKNVYALWRAKNITRENSPQRLINDPYRTQTQQCTQQMCTMLMFSLYFSTSNNYSNSYQIVVFNLLSATDHQTKMIMNRLKLYCSAV